MKFIAACVIAGLFIILLVRNHRLHRKNTKLAFALDEYEKSVRDLFQKSINLIAGGVRHEMDNRELLQENERLRLERDAALANIELVVKELDVTEQSLAEVVTDLEKAEDLIDQLEDEVTKPAAVKQ